MVTDGPEREVAMSRLGAYDSLQFGGLPVSGAAILPEACWRSGVCAKGVAARQLGASLLDMRPRES